MCIIHLHCVFYAVFSFLPQIVCFSKTLQDNESATEIMRVKLDATLLKLSKYDIRKKLTDFSDENITNLKYCDHQLTSVATRRVPGENDLSAVIDKTTSELEKLVKATSDCIEKRFDSFSSNDVLCPFKIMEPRSWPTEKDKSSNI